MKIIGIIDRHSGPAYHRVLLPYHSIEGLNALFTNKINEDQVKDIDALIVPRFSVYNTLQDILKWRDKYGFKLIVDVDDFWQLDRNHLGFNNWKQHGIPMLFQLYVKSADMVTCTHERLYDEIKDLNKSVEVLPNAIPFKDQFAIEKTESDKVRLFWAGSVHHKGDIVLLKNGLQKLHVDKVLREKVLMIMAGYSDEPAWHYMAGIYTNIWRLEGSVLKGTTPFEYYEAYKFCDVGLIPLAENRFNSFKSNLKILECANMAAPCIVSKVNPYLNIPHVLYVEHQTDWFKHIKYFVENESYRVEMGQHLQAWCRKHFNFEKINEKRLQLLEYVTEKAVV